MSVVVSMEEVSSCERQLRIEVPGPAVTAERQRVEQEIRRRSRLPGFRKGKAPLGLVRRHYQDDIESEMVERLVPRYWQQARAEAQLRPLLPPRVADVELEPETMRFTAVVEIYPSVRVDRLDGFDLPEPATEPTPEEVARALEDLRREAGTWRAVERPAAQGDRVRVQVDEQPETQEPSFESPGSASEREPAQFEIGDPQVWEELSVAAAGLAAGQRGRFERREGEGEREEEKLRRFEIRVVEVAERELPELDDAFAQRVGELESLDALREEVRKQLAAARQRDRRQQREKALLEQLRDRYPMTLPERVVQRQAEDLARDWAAGLSRQGVDLERAEIDWPALFDDLRPHAERRVHARLLLDLAVEQHDVSLPPAELEQALAEIGRLEGRPAAHVRQRLAASGTLEELEAQLKRRHLVDRLLGEAPAQEESELDATVEDGGAEAEES